MPLAEAPKVNPKVTVTVTKTAVLRDSHGKPALELTAENGSVKIALLPRNGQRREPVKITDLRQALDSLDAA